MSEGSIPVSYTADGAVAISYKDLRESPQLLAESIEKSFGSHPDSLGIIIVENLPEEYTRYRERLLKLAYNFAELGPDACEKYVDERSKYSFGWSHGKEIMNGKLGMFLRCTLLVALITPSPDTLKGSYYANPVIDKPMGSADEQAAFPEYYGENIWPNADEAGVEGFEQAFKELGRFIFKVGCQLAVACQPFALSHGTLSLPDLIGTSQTTKARLLHYFPPSEVDASQIAREDEPVDSWCGFHLDHSLLTGLCSAMFLKKVEGSDKPAVVPPPSPKAGLYIRTRGGELTKVSIPVDCLAFQTGEALEIATGRKLLATPHCVRVVPGPDAADVSRETFALFMQPNTDQQLSPSMTFGQFSKKVFEDHYQNTGL